MTIHDSGGVFPLAPSLAHAEPGGITIEYHASRPLGMLLAILVPSASVMKSPPPKRQSQQQSEPNLPQSGLLKPIAVGLDAALVPSTRSLLYLRVNDSSARLSDNKGRVEITVQKQ